MIKSLTLNNIILNYKMRVKIKRIAKYILPNHKIKIYEGDVINNNDFIIFESNKTVDVVLNRDKFEDRFRYSDRILAEDMFVNKLIIDIIFQLRYVLSRNTKRHSLRTSLKYDEYLFNCISKYLNVDYDVDIDIVLKSYNKLASSIFEKLKKHYTDSNSSELQSLILDYRIVKGSKDSLNVLERFISRYVVILNN